MKEQIFESLTEGEKKQLAKGIIPAGLLETLKGTSVSEKALIEIAKKHFKIKETPKVLQDKNTAATIEEEKPKEKQEVENQAIAELAQIRKENPQAFEPKKTFSAAARIERLSNLNTLVARHANLKSKLKDFDEIMLISDDTVSNLSFRRGNKTFEVANSEVIKEVLEIVGLRLRERIDFAEKAIETFEI
jgi:hypothetical protein